MEPIADLDVLREVLRPMVERKLIVFLGPEGRRGTTLTHGFHSAEELAAVPRDEAIEPSRPAIPRSAESVRPDSGVSWQTEVATLRSELAELREQVQRLGEMVASRTNSPTPG
jgi:hypothetical protein